MSPSRRDILKGGAFAALFGSLAPRVLGEGRQDPIPKKPSYTAKDVMETLCHENEGASNHKEWALVDDREAQIAKLERSRSQYKDLPITQEVQDWSHPMTEDEMTHKDEVCIDTSIGQKDVPLEVSPIVKLDTRAIKSITVTTDFELEQVFVCGQLELMDQVEAQPTVTCTVEYFDGCTEHYIGGREKSWCDDFDWTCIDPTAINSCGFDTENKVAIIPDSGVYGEVGKKYTFHIMSDRDHTVTFSAYLSAKEYHYGEV